MEKWTKHLPYIPVQYRGHLLDSVPTFKLNAHNGYLQKWDNEELFLPTEEDIRRRAQEKVEQEKAEQEKIVRMNKEFRDSAKSALNEKLKKVNGTLETLEKTNANLNDLFLKYSKALEGYNNPELPTAIEELIKENGLNTLRDEIQSYINNFENAFVDYEVELKVLAEYGKESQELAKEYTRCKDKYLKSQKTLYKKYRITNDEKEGEITEYMIKMAKENSAKYVEMVTDLKEKNKLLHDKYDEVIKLFDGIERKFDIENESPDLLFLRVYDENGNVIN